MCEFCKDLGFASNSAQAHQSPVTRTEGMCRDLFERIEKELDELSQGRINPSYKSDYIKIFAIMSSETIFLRELAKLNKYISKHRVDLSDIARLRLSSILSSYETKCWFHETVLIPLGFLDGDYFLHLIRRGYVLKDFGADVLHGEFTHRLQWFVLSSIITSDFKQGKDGELWDHTPLDLYTSLAEGAQLWGALVDRGGNKKGFSPKFAYPDEFNNWLNSQSKTSEIGKLVEFFEYKNARRANQLIEALQDFAAEKDDGEFSRDEVRGYLDEKGLFTARQNDPKSAFHTFDRFKTIEAWMRTEYIPGMLYNTKEGGDDTFDEEAAEGRRKDFLAHKQKLFVSAKNSKSNKLSFIKIRGNILAPFGTTIEDDLSKIDERIKKSINLKSI